MFTSLRFRLWLTYVAVAAATVFIAVVAVVVYLLRNPADDRRELQRLRLTTNVLLQRSQLFSTNIDNFNTPRLKETMERVDAAFGVRASVYSTNGELLADSRTATAAALPAWSELRNRPAGTSTIFRDADGKQWLYVVTPVQGGYFLVLSTPRPRLPVISILRDEFLTPFTRGILLALVLSLILAFWIARWITAPLQRISDATQSISQGEFQQIPMQGPQEVRSLARAFNEMGSRVQASQRSQRDFIANVSHDLKTPLTSIQGFAQAILDGTATTTEALQQAGGVILAEAARMHRMVLDLLELARLDSGVVNFERAPVSIVDLLQGIVEKFTFQARQAGISLQFSSEDLEGQSAQIVGDADRLAQVFSNLIDNALKYTPESGQVELSVGMDGSWAEILVADTGLGIPHDEIERIFERFYQTDKSRSSASRRGVGLGLAIAKEIIQAHGGTISARNRLPLTVHDRSDDTEQPAGSEFLVRLPCSLQDDTTLVKRR